MQGLSGLLRVTANPARSAVSQTGADSNRQQAIAKLNDARLIVLGMLLYAQQHQDRCPTNLEDIGVYLRNQNQQLTGTNAFDVLYQGSINRVANPSTGILIRESKPFQTSNGT